MAESRMDRRRRAEEIAKKYDVDVGDVEHVLFNLTLEPLQRLAKSLRRARRGRFTLNRSGITATH